MILQYFRNRRIRHLKIRLAGLEEQKAADPERHSYYLMEYGQAKEELRFLMEKFKND